MEFIILLILIAFFMCLLFYIFQINMKKVKSFSKNEKLDNLVNKLPDNITICEYILKILNNEKVKVKEETETKTSLYIVATNTISIANIKESFTRVQTIAHECLHSVQSRKKLMFNYIYTNVYIIYFLIVTILTILGKIQNFMLQIEVLTIMGFVHYFVRSYLEMQAMLKAKYLAKQYMEETKILKQEEINEIVAEYDKLNDDGIKLMMFIILANDLAKAVLYIIICLIKNIL